MIHFAYPNAPPTGFIGCGRYIASEYQPDKYKTPSDIINQENPKEAARILAYYESLRVSKKDIYEKKDMPEIYTGESMHLAYLLALISRTRNIRLKTDTDIWCTGSIAIIDGNPSLKPVSNNGFDIKLRQGFLSEENQDKLFIVPNDNFSPAHQELCDQKNARVLSVEQFGELSLEYRFEEKTVLKVRSVPDELFKLTSLVFEMSSNPYKGLEYFDKDDAELFFGREDKIEEILKNYEDMCKTSFRFMAIMGPSGSGKSSIARAGLIPKIRKDKTKTSIIVFRPGDHPLKELESLMISDSAETLIIVDQFEEIYSMCEDKQERTQFVRKLLDYADSDKHRNISVIIVFRADFLGHAQSHPELSHAIAKNTIIVPAMSRDNLRAAIAEPARRAGYVFDNQIVDELISQTDGHNGALPLLQFALSRIWQGMEKGVRPEKTLKDINGVGGALAKKAQELYDSLSEQDRRIAKRIFLSLKNVGEGIFDTRRRILLSEIIEENDYKDVVRVLEIFSSPGARIITLSSGSDKNNMPEDKNKETTVEITHEALFENWDLFKKWIEKIHREDILFHRRLSLVAKHWKVNNRAKGLLWRPPDLDRLQKFYEDMPIDMTPLQIEFYEESKKAKKREEIQRKAIGSLIMIIILLIGAYNALSLKQENLKLKEKIKTSNRQKVSRVPKNDFKLTITKTGNGKISSAPAGIDCGTNCIKSYSACTDVTLTATPDSDFTFTGWSGDCSGKNAKATVMMNSSKTCMAKFESKSSACNSMTDGLVAWYPFDGDTQDKSGNRNHGEAKGNLTYAAGKIGQAAKFDGRSSYIEVPHHDSLNLEGFTLSVWVYDYQHPVSESDASTILILGSKEKKYKFFSSLYRKEFAHFEMFDSKYKDQDQEILRSIHSIPINQWKHIAVAYDGHFLIMYIDGKLDNGIDAGSPFFIDGKYLPLTIGAVFSNDNSQISNVKDGLIDDLRIYNRVLSESEITQLYECANANATTQKRPFIKSMSISQ